MGNLDRGQQPGCEFESRSSKNVDNAWAMQRPAGGLLPLDCSPLGDSSHPRFQYQKDEN